MFQTLNFLGVRRVSTIYALSSGQGKCGVAVIRVSGPQASQSLLRMTRLKQLPTPRQAVLTKIYDPVTSQQLDHGLVLWFPGPRSFTGEDSCEFQVHGGNAVKSSMLTALSKLDKFRHAEPGEFTKRAFHAGKHDLTEVEGLADLIHAETEMQHKQALIQMEGALSQLYNTWRTQILQNMAHIEAYIDFSEEDNIEDGIMEQSNKNLQTVMESIEKHLSDKRKGERLRDGVRTVIVGEPNVGKSSLLNLLSQKQAAIVTPIAGTTRDIIELQINIDGYLLLLADTAGLRKDSQDIVESEGISKALKYAQESDLILLVINSQQIINIKNVKEFNNFLKNYLTILNLDNIMDNDMKFNKKCLLVFNKMDLITSNSVNEIIDCIDNGVGISCKTNEGLDQFLSLISNELKSLCATPTRENPSLTQARHRTYLTECYKCLQKYFTLHETGAGIDISAQQLRSSLRYLGKITGHVTTEDLLDIIFKDFCIGK